MSVQINPENEKKWRNRTVFFFSIFLFSFPHPYVLIWTVTFYGWVRLWIAKKQKRGYSSSQPYSSREYLGDVIALGISAWFVSFYVLPFILEEYQFEVYLSFSLETLVDYSLDRLAQIGFAGMCLIYFWLLLFFVESLATDESASLWKFKALLFMKTQKKHNESAKEQ